MVIKLHTTWEAGPGNLFNAATSNATSNIGAARGTKILEQVVPRAGTNNVPFARDINVVGRAHWDLEHILSKRLSQKAVK